MDPTLLVCEIYDSFSEDRKPFNDSILPKSYSARGTPNLAFLPAKTSLKETSNLPAVYADEEKYKLLNEIKNRFNSDKFSISRDAMNPFEQLGRIGYRSIFMNRAAIKLANIDAIFHLTKHLGGMIRMRVDDDFSFCDVAAGPGGFTEYIQFRQERAKGYGMTIRGDLDWKFSSLDMGRFMAFYGDDNTGNLYKNWEWFVKRIIDMEGDGTDLVMGDGGFEISEGEDFSRQEWLSTRLLLCQILIGIGCCRPGGNFLVKIFDTVTEISAQLIYILSCCFETITIFKPVSSRPANSERYMICKGKKESVGQYYNLLKQAADLYTDETVLSQIIKSVPEDFMIWLREQNELSINRQIEMGKSIVSHMNGEEVIVPKYNLRQALIAWNLPGNVPGKTD